MKILSIPRKQTVIAALCGVSLFSLAACKDKPKTADPEKAAEEAGEPARSEAAAEIDPSGFNSNRAQAFGFLSRMPSSTEGALGLLNLSDTLAGFLGSNTYKRAVALLQESGALDFDQDSVQMAQAMIDQYVGKELFLILSEGCGTQLGRLQIISNLLSDINMQSAGAAIAGGGAGGPETMQEMQKQLKAGLADENSELSQALAGFEFPPIIVGTKVSDGADEVIAQLDALEEQLPKIFTVSKIEAGGGKFTSWRLNLQDVFDEGAKASLNELLQDDAATDRVAELIRKKKVEFCFGVMDNYLVFSLGSDHSHLNFVTKPEESILAAKAFGFSDQFLAKKLAAYGYLSKAILSGPAQGGQIERMANAFARGLGSGAGATKKLATLVKQLAGHAEKLAQRGSQTYVGLAYMDKGIHGESIGGYTTDTVDSKSKSQFANSAPADAALVISSVANPEYRAESIAMMETLFSGVEVGVEVWADTSGDGSALEQFGQMKEMFGGNLTKIWGIMKGKFLDGLGSQSGIIVDLKGGMPKGIPGLPNVLQNEGKVPRIALATNVVDRAKLAEAWKELVPELNASFMKIPGQEAGSEMQVPDVMSDEATDLVTHYFSFPFFTNDFMPSLSLNDEVFILSTSKQFAQGLASSAKDGAGDIRGTYVKMDFAELQRFAEDWLALVSKNADQLFPDEFQAKEFTQTAGQIKQVLEFARGIRGLEWNRYEGDSGAMRSSWHLQFEDIGAGGE